MSHDPWKAQVLDLAIGALPPAQARALEAHLASCPECAAELASLRAAGAAVASLPPLEAPERGEAILLAAARQAAEAHRRPARRLRSWLWGAALGGAAAAAALVVSLQLSAGPHPSRFDEGRDALLGRAGPAAEPPAEAARAIEAPAAAPSPRLDQAAQASPGAPPTPAMKLAPAPPAMKEAPATPAIRAPARPATSATPDRGIGIGAAGGSAARAPAPPRTQALAAPEPESSAALAGDVAAPAPPMRRNGLAAEGDLAPETKAAAAKAEAASARAAPASRSAARADAADRAGEAKGTLGGGPAPAASRPLVPEVRTDPACVGEARRVLWRDAAGRLLRRERAGVLGGVAYRAEETFDPGGALTEARVEAGGRVATADGVGVAAGRLAGLADGLRLAATATQAEAEPPRCGP